MCVGGYNHVAFYGNMAVVVLVFVEVGWRSGLAQEAAEWTPKPPKKCREVGAGGNAAREGERDACGGRGAHFLVVRH